MTISLKHAFASQKADGGDATLIQPSNWNADHVLTQATGRLLGRISPGVGNVEELTGSNVASILVASGAAREVLTANRTYYVRTDGSDSNDGLTNTAGGAFASLQKAIDTALKLDFNGFTVTIQLADGAYTAGGVIGPGVGITAISRFVIQGNAASPGNVIVSTPSGSVISAVSGGIVTLKDMELRGGHYCIEAGGGGQVSFRNLRFGAASVMHMYASRGGKIATSGNYSIVGSAPYHIYIEMQGSISAGGMAVTLTGTPNFSYFAYCSSNSIFDAWGMSFIGGATGGRYAVSLGGGIYVGGGGANYFPGDVAGSVTSPGWYV